MDQTNAWKDTLSSSLEGTVRDYAFASTQTGQIYYSNFALQPEEVLRIVKAFADQNQLLQSGITIGGNRYIVLTVTGSTIYARQGQTALCCIRCETGLLIGLSQGLAPANLALQKLAGYFVETGY